MAHQLAPIAVSCGEPAGIGPELAHKARAALHADLDFFVIGDPRHFAAHGPVAEITSPSEASSMSGPGLPVLPLNFGPSPVKKGRPDPNHAAKIVTAIETAVGLCQTGQASALCTLPISKIAVKAGGAFAFPGHTEFLAHLAGDSDVAMMLACDELRVVPVTIHIALRDVSKALTPTKVEKVIRLTHAALRRDFGIARPRIAVAGVNPHAGENGEMGQEELEWLAPLVENMRVAGLDVTGPLPADTMFHAQARARYDAAVAMYHDQALIPIKTIAFDQGVNVTLGLPFVRTSPDHGTAFDIAGQGIARADSLIAALIMARDIALRRRAAA